MKSIAITAVLAFILSACGGGGPGTSSTPETTPPSPALASLTAKPLAANKVSLTLSGVGSQAGTFCITQNTITQNATPPEAEDSCFSDALVQEKTIAATSDTQRVVFTAWVRSGNTVSRHASVSAPGKTCSAAALAALTAANTTLPAVCIITGSGESVLLLESAKAPITVANFLRYVNQGFYDQTVFHRFWKGNLNFVQGGERTYDANQIGESRYPKKASTLPPIVLESTVNSNLTNTANTIAMARTSPPDPLAPDSATAGFFVNTAANAGFNSTNSRDGYAVFGRIVHGTDVWTALLDSVANTGEVTFPSTPVHLHWAYQIQ